MWLENLGAGSPVQASSLSLQLWVFMDLQPHSTLPSSLQNETDESQIQMAGGDVELPRELAKMIEEDTEEEEEKASVLGQLASLPGLDLGSLKDKAQATLGDLKQSAEKCYIM